MVYAQHRTRPQKNETPKLLWDFEVQTIHLISAGRPELEIVNKKKRTSRIVDFAVPADHRVKLKENEKRESTWNLLRKWKKLRNMKVTVIPTLYNHQRVNKGTGGLENKRKSGDHRNDNIIKIGQDTEKSPRDLRRFAVTQIQVRNH